MRWDTGTGTPPCERATPRSAEAEGSRGDRFVRGRALSREPRTVEEAVVVLEGGLAVEGRVDPGKVGRIEVVLDRELPVPLHVEAELAVGGGRAQAPLVTRPPENLEALREGADPRLERLRVAAKVDEHEVQPHPAPHRPEPVPGAIEAFRLVDSEASEVGGSDQPAFEVVGPGMVRAPDPALHPDGLPDELVAAVRADVVEHPYRVALRANHEERHADDAHGPEIPRPRHVRRVAEAGPRGREDPLELELEEVGVRVGAVGKPGRLLDGTVDHGGELGDGKVRGHRGTSRVAAPGRDARRGASRRPACVECAARVQRLRIAPRRVVGARPRPVPTGDGTRFCTKSSRLSFARRKSG